MRLLVKKSNSLVEARYHFSLWEMRVFTKMITMVKSADADFREYRIYLRELVEEFGLTRTKASYDFLRDAANSLLQKEVSIYQQTEDGLNETRTHLIVGATTQVQGSNLDYIEVSFHPKLKPHILALKDKYTIYEVKNVLNLPSSYSIRIYELLKQYERIGHRTFTVDEFKEMIGAKQTVRLGKGKEEVRDKYPLYGSLNQKVLKPAQRHLVENTDLCFEFEPLKRSRRITRIKFVIMRNPRYESAPDQAAPAGSGSGAGDSKMVSAEEQATVARLYVQVEQFVEESVVRKWVAAYPEDQIQYGINYTLAQLKAGKKIENVGGYLHTMITTDALMTARKAEEKKREMAEAKERKRKKELAQVEEETEQLAQRIREKVESTIRGIFDRHPEAKVEAFETARKRRNSGYRADRTKAENMQDALFRATFVTIVRKRYPEHFAEVAELEGWAKKLRGKKTRLKG